MADVTRKAVKKAHRLIAPHIRETPVLMAAPADMGLTAEMPQVALKLEQLQHTGSFKARGALFTLLSQPVPAAGVVAASGGNHGAAVAWAAAARGVPAHIFVPEVTPAAKRTRIEGYGARLHVTGAFYSDAFAESQRFAAESGALQIHAYDAPGTLLGQGTVAREFLRQAPLDTLLVATGGGGLIGGIAAYVEDRVRLVSVEPGAAPTLHDALHAGRPVEAPAGGIAADSLAPRMIGTIPFDLAARFVDAAVLVPDDAIRAAQRHLWDTFRVVTEPGGAAATAALLSGAYRPVAGERVGVLVCGANTDAVRFPD